MKTYKLDGGDTTDRRTDREDTEETGRKMPKLKDNIHTNRPNIKELTQEDGGTRLTELN